MNTPQQQQQYNHPPPLQQHGSNPQLPTYQSTVPNQQSQQPQQNQQPQQSTQQQPQQQQSAQFQPQMPSYPQPLIIPPNSDQSNNGSNNNVINYPPSIQIPNYVQFSPHQQNAQFQPQMPSYAPQQPQQTHQQQPQHQPQSQSHQPQQQLQPQQYAYQPVYYYQHQPPQQGGQQAPQMYRAPSSPQVVYVQSPLPSSSPSPGGTGVQGGYPSPQPQPQLQHQLSAAQMIFQNAQQGAVGVMMMNNAAPSPFHSPSMTRQPSSPSVDLSNSAYLQGYNIDFKEINFQNKIGAGAFGEVWKGEWAGTSVAIKKIASETIKEKDLQEFSSEILLMSKLRHPNIVQFLGACLHPDFFCLLTEFMDKGSLFHCLQKEPNIPPTLRLQIATDIAKGMVYLHTRNPPIVHRDIKSLNILIAKDWKATITDFGLTKIKDKAMLTTRCGSPAWSAPEVLRGEPYTEKVDVYGYGIVLWEIVSGQPPYKGMDPVQLIQAVAYKKPALRPPLPACQYPQLVDLMQRCWQDDPSLRPDFQYCLDVLKRIEASIN